MKSNKNYKKIVMSSMAALGLVMLPVAEAVAADGDQTMSVTDTVVVTVSATCGVFDSYSVTEGTGAVTSVDATNKTYSKTMINGELWNKENTGSLKNGATYTVACNDAAGWSVSASGTGTRAGAETKMASSNGSENDIASGLATSGPVANWAYKIASVTGNVQMASGLTVNSYMPVTNSSAVVKSAGPTSAGSTFTTGYQVYIGTETPAGTYTGKVTYTLAHPVAEKSSPSPAPTKGGDTKGGEETKKTEEVEKTEGTEEDNANGTNTIVVNNDNGSNGTPTQTQPLMSMAPSNYSAGTNGGDTLALGGDSEEQKTGALGVQKASGTTKNTGNTTTPKVVAAASKPEEDNAGLIIGLCAAAVVAAGAGAYLYSKNMEEE